MIKYAHVNFLKNTEVCEIGIISWRVMYESENVLTL